MMLELCNLCLPLDPDDLIHLHLCCPLQKSFYSHLSPTSERGGGKELRKIHRGRLLFGVESKSAIKKLTELPLLFQIMRPKNPKNATLFFCDQVWRIRTPKLNIFYCQYSYQLERLSHRVEFTICTLADTLDK